MNHEQIDQFYRDGFVCIPNFFPKSQMEDLKTASMKVVEEFDMSQVVPFVTGEAQVETTQEFLMTSGDKVRCFFEAGALKADGSLKTERKLAVNKLGHAMHDLNSEFEKFSYQQRLKDIVKSLGYQKPAIVQSMYIFKQPGIGGEVVPHQDGTFLISDPPSCIGIWIAVEDARIDNGCLRAKPGTHKDGIQKLFIRDGETRMKFDRPTPEDWTMSDMTPLPLEQGGIIILNGAVLHGSYENQSHSSRHAYTLHIAELHNTKWDERNWLQRPSSFPFRDMFNVPSSL